jgi:hypothetical protein
MTTELKQALVQISDLHKRITGGEKPEDGLLWQVCQLESTVNKYHNEDAKMHKFIRHWLIGISVVLLINVLNGRIVIDHKAIAQLIKYFGGV